MKRRRARPIAFALLLIAATALCLRSYFVVDTIRWSRPTGDRQIHEIHLGCDWSWLAFGFGRIYRSRGEKVGLQFNHQPAEPLYELSQLYTGEWVDASMGSLPPQINLPGLRIRWTHRIDKSGRVIWTFLLVGTLWIPITFFAAVAIYLTWRHKRSNRRRPGHCPACGYDVRATPEKCPECGATIGDGSKTAT